LNEPITSHHRPILTRRTAAASVPADLKERLQQLQHHQQFEAASPIDEAKSDSAAPDRAKANPHELQLAFLKAHLNKPITVSLISGIRLTGTLKQFDTYSLLLSGDAGDNLIFKHAISTLRPATARPPIAPVQGSISSNANHDISRVLCKNTKSRLSKACCSASASPKTST
jgi:host factor-I protein